MCVEKGPKVFICRDVDEMERDLNLAANMEINDTIGSIRSYLVQYLFTTFVVSSLVSAVLSALGEFVGATASFSAFLLLLAWSVPLLSKLRPRLVENIIKIEFRSDEEQKH